LDLIADEPDDEPGSQMMYSSHPSLDVFWVMIQNWGQKDDRATTAITSVGTQEGLQGKRKTVNILQMRRCFGVRHRPKLQHPRCCDVMSDCSKILYSWT